MYSYVIKRGRWQSGRFTRSPESPVDPKSKIKNNNKNINRDAKGGAGNRIRTCDPLITNEMLYQLSYSGACGYHNQQNRNFQVICYFVCFVRLIYSIPHIQFYKRLNPVVSYCVCQSFCHPWKFWFLNGWGFYRYQHNNCILKPQIVPAVFRWFVYTPK